MVGTSCDLLHFQCWQKRCKSHHSFYFLSIYTLLVTSASVIEYHNFIRNPSFEDTDDAQTSPSFWQPFIEDFVFSSDTAYIGGKSLKLELGVSSWRGAGQFVFINQTWVSPPSATFSQPYPLTNPLSPPFYLTWE